MLVEPGILALDPVMRGRNPVSPSEYAYSHSESTYGHDYLLWPAVDILNREVREKSCPRRVFDLGCGNGAVARDLLSHSFAVTGVDLSASGIANAKAADPKLDLHVGSAYDDLASRFGQFPLVVSFEVVEHLYDPRTFARTVFNLLEPGGLAVISTPYHGYLKNLAIALTNGFDAHWSPLWDHGHIKFWSVATITELLTEAGFIVGRIHRVGRGIPALGKSMLIEARRPISPA